MAELVAGTSPSFLFCVPIDFSVRNIPLVLPEPTKFLLIRCNFNGMLGSHCIALDFMTHVVP